MTYASVKELADFIDKNRGKARRIVAFYSSDPRLAPWEWFTFLVPALREKGFVVLALTTYALSECVQESLPCFLVNKVEIASLQGIDCFICLDTDTACFPQGSRVLAVAHGYRFVRTATSLAASVRTMLHFDGYLVNFPLADSRTTLPRTWQGLWPKFLYKRQSRRFDILSCGYLRSAALYERLKGWTSAPDSLCYAPMWRHYARDLGGDRIFLYARDILQYLLSAFPQYSVIFRPFSYDLEDPFIQELAADFRGESRFIFDDSSDKFITFARSAALVTDISHIANSFAFTTLRPTLAFRPWEKRLDLVSQPFGGIVSTLEQLGHGLRYFLTHQSATCQFIRDERARGTLPIENVVEEFPDLLDAFLDNLPRNDLPNNWLTIQRNGIESETSVAEMILRLFAMPRYTRFHLQQIAVSDTLKDEQIFWAALLLAWSKAAPEAELLPLEKAALMRFIPADMPVPQTYGASLAAAHYLVRRALQILPNAGQQHYTELCYRLLEMCAVPSDA